MLNVAFSELKMKKGKVVLTNRGSIKYQGSFIMDELTYKLSGRFCNISLPRQEYLIGVSSFLLRFTLPAIVILNQTEGFGF